MTLIPLRRLRPAPAPAPPSGPPLVDPQARAVKYLRVSLTDHCNFRCTYCMPEAGVEQVARRELLTLAEVVLVVRAFAAWGVERVRLTGGEPTVRQGLVELVTELSQISVGGDTDRKLQVVMTTNGVRLVELAAPLHAAGLTGLTVSIDSLDPTRFREITRRGELSQVLAGLEAATAAGFLGIKLNTVAVRGFNDDEIGALATWAWARPASSSSCRCRAAACTCPASCCPPASCVGRSRTTSAPRWCPTPARACGASGPRATGVSLTAASLASASG